MNKLPQRISLFALSMTFVVAVSHQPSGQAKNVSGQTPTTNTSPVTVSHADELARALQLFRSGKFDEASQEYNSILTLDPNSARSYVGLARVYLKQKKTTEAYAAAAKAEAIDPKLDAVRVVIGEVYFRQGKLPAAAGVFGDLIRTNTTEARAYLGMGRFYHAASFYKLAKTAIDRAHSLDPADPDIRKEWLRTLNHAQARDALTAYLGDAGNDDAEERHNLESSLDLLKETIHPCRLTSTVTTAEIGLEQLLIDPTHIRGYGLGVRVNGVSSKLQLDTGASGILINRKTAERAGIKPITHHQIKGVGDSGTVGGFVGYADTVKIGNLEFQNCFVEVVDKGGVAGEEGLIGADVFDSFLVDLDFPHGKLKLSQLPPRPDDPAPGAEPSPNTRTFQDRYIAPEMKSFTPILRFGHGLLINTQLNELPAKLFLIDTGAFANTISPSAAREVTGVSSDSNVTVKGLNGKVNSVFRANSFTMQFGRLRQKNQDTVAFDIKTISDSIGTEVSGLLGFTTLVLLEIKIDYRDGLVDLIYHPR